MRVSAPRTATLPYVRILSFYFCFGHLAYLDLSWQILSFFFFAGCGNDGHFKELCAVMERPDLATQEAYATNEMRVKNRNELVSILTEEFTKKTNAEWDEILGGKNALGTVVRFAYGPVNTISQVFADPQVIHNNLAIPMKHETLGQIMQV